MSASSRLSPSGSPPPLPRAQPRQPETPASQSSPVATDGDGAGTRVAGLERPSVPAQGSRIPDHSASVGTTGTTLQSASAASASTSAEPSSALAKAEAAL